MTKMPGNGNRRIAPHGIAFDTNYYSVPYNLVHELVEMRSTPTTIEIFHKRQRVKSHLRAQGHGHAITVDALGSDHRPAHCSAVPTQIGDPTLADGILVRLVHNARRIDMRGDSMRKNRGKANTYNA